MARAAGLGRSGQWPGPQVWGEAGNCTRHRAEDADVAAQTSQ